MMDNFESNPDDEDFFDDFDFEDVEINPPLTEEDLRLAELEILIF